VRRRFVDERTRKRGAVFIPAKVDDNPGLDVAEYRETLGNLPETLQAQLLDGDWQVFQGMAFPDWDPQIHVVRAFPIPEEWERFESFDHGTTNPSCLLGYAIDHDGNVVCFDSHYAPGLPSTQAAAINAKRAVWYPERRNSQPWWPVCWADPEMWATKGETRWGTPASDITDYEELGIGGFIRANNDRSAGRTRIAEMLKPQPNRYFPHWHPLYGQTGAPQFFVVGERCPQLIEQLQTAPLLPLDSGQKDAGEIIDPAWESPHGHATAALRYGLMSRTAAPKPLERIEWPDTRARALDEFWQKQRERDAQEDRGPRPVAYGTRFTV
jgi:hypothetical protein